MNTKDLTKYQNIGKLLNSKPDCSVIVPVVSELAQIDFTVAFEAWETLLNNFSKQLSDKTVCENIEQKVLQEFNSISEAKTRQHLMQSTPLLKLIYGCCATSCCGKNLEILVWFILAAKFECAEIALAAIRANTTEDFGERMRVVLDAVFKTYCESKGVKKCELTRKQSAFLLSHIEKIKGANKMLLTQRIKEL